MKQEMPFLKASSSAADTVTFTRFGLSPPLASTIRADSRAPPDADTCAVCFSLSPPPEGLSAPRPKPFFFGSSSFLASFLSSLFLVGG